MLLLDLWHSKMDQMLASINTPMVDGEDVISCDTLKFWLEEAHSLELVEKESKFVQLNELVDDIENVIKAIRACTSRE